MRLRYFALFAVLAAPLPWICDDLGNEIVNMLLARAGGLQTIDGLVDAAGQKKIASRPH